MSSIKDKIINDIIVIEGGYIDHPSDLGGPTKYGITEKVAREHGYTGDMIDLPRDLAYKIYQMSYWDVNKLTQIEQLSQGIAFEMADTGVNMGVKIAQTFLQRSLNALNLQGQAYPDIVVDGLIGAKSIGALDAYLKHRGKDGEVVLLRLLNALQAARYVELAEAREANEDFVFGWVLHRVVI